MVALNVWPTDGAAGSVANEAKWRKMARHWARSGVLAGIGGELKPTYSSGTVTVADGAAWVDGHFVEVTGSQGVAVGTTGIVVVRFDPVANTAELLYRDGVSTPTQNPAGVWELVLARMATTMTDLRIFAGPETVPWAAPWGRIGAVVLTTASGNTGAENDVNAASLSFTPVPGRAYSVGLRIPRVVQATSNGEMRVRITDSGNVGKGSGSLWSYYAASVNYSAAVFIDSYETGLGPSLTTRKARTSNTGPGHTFDFSLGLAGLFFIDDVGPAGARPTQLESLEYLETDEYLEQAAQLEQLEAAS